MQTHCLMKIMEGTLGQHYYKLWFIFQGVSVLTPRMILLLKISILKILIRLQFTNSTNIIQTLGA